MQKKTKDQISLIRKKLKPGSHPGLTRVQRFCDLLGNPEQRINFIHVAGTNGKGSVSTMMQRILTESGYRTGLFTSPFLASPLEYFCIDGFPIREDEFCELNHRLLAVADSMEEPPTEFEFYTVAAIVYFSQKQCDFIILEAGMGGRLDATNVIPSPELCMITNIGIDHKEYLGDSYEKIAEEKAGILKRGTKVVLYPSVKEALTSILRKAEQLEIKPVVADEKRLTVISDVDSGNEEDGIPFSYRSEDGSDFTIELPTAAKFQRLNCAVVLEGACLLEQRGYCLPKEKVQTALRSFFLPARFEIISQTPLVIADGGHNPQCIDALLESFDPFYRKIKQAQGKVSILTGMMRDKDYRYIYKRLSEYADEFIVVSAGVERALTTKELINELSQYGKPCWDEATIQESTKMALKRLRPQDCLLVSGSFYIMDDIRKQIMNFEWRRL